MLVKSYENSFSEQILGEISAGNAAVFCFFMYWTRQTCFRGSRSIKVEACHYLVPVELVAAPKKEMAAIAKMLLLLRLTASLLLALSIVRHESVNGEITDDDDGANRLMRPTQFTRRSGRLENFYPRISGDPFCE